MNLVVFDKETGQINMALGDVSGAAIWAVAEWLEAHDDGLPYEIFGLGHRHGYRLSVQRIQNPFLNDDPEEDMQWPRSGGF